jgi:drug/metabolite transporter (DMT)-like permease
VTLSDGPADQGDGCVNRFVLTLLLLAVTAVWGWTFAVVKDAIAVYGVVPFLAVRFVIGTAALSIVAARRVTRRSCVAGGLIGAILAAAYLLQTFGLRYTTATNCGLITGLFAVFALLANRALFGVRVHSLFWLAVGLGVVGLLLLTGADPSRPAMGDLLTLGCAACFGVQIALLDRYAKGHDPFALTLVQLASASIIFLFAWPITDTVSWPAAGVWFALIVTGVLATAAGFCIQVLVQQRLPAARVAIILATEPVFAALFGFLAGDRLTLLQISGAALMVGAVVLSEVGTARISIRRPISEP